MLFTSQAAAIVSQTGKYYHLSAMAALSLVVSCFCGGDDDYQPLNSISIYPRLVITHKPKPEALLRMPHHKTRSLTAAETATIDDIIVILRNVAIYDSRPETAK